MIQKPTTLNHVGTLKDLRFVDSDESLLNACEMMKLSDLNQMPVTEDEEIVGMLTASDVARALNACSGLESTIKVREVMTVPVRTLPLGTSLMDAARAMIDSKSSALMLTHPDARVAGIVSIDDLLKAFVATYKDKKTDELGHFDWLSHLPVRQFIDELANTGI
ncbi:MAG: CBS domain-containing protein [Bdellovibrionota bacterium]